MSHGLMAVVCLDNKEIYTHIAAASKSGLLAYINIIKPYKGRAAHYVHKTHCR